MKKIAGIALGALLCLSCSPPPFDLSLSRAAATIQKLTQDNSTSVIVDIFDTSNQWDSFFIPQLLATGFDYSAGFVTIVRNQSLAIYAVMLDPTSGRFKPYAQTQVGIPGPDAYAPAAAAVPEKGGSSFFLGTVYDAVHPDASGFGSFRGDTGTKNLFPVVGGRMADTLQAATGLFLPVLGTSVFALAGSGYDTMHWLAQQPSPAGFLEFAFTCGAGTVSFQGPLRGMTPWSLPFIPAGTTRVMYYYDENPAADPARSPNRSYASWYDTAAGAWQCATWWGTAAGDWKLLPTVTARVDALLTNGYLLSTEGGSGRVYDREGALLAVFPVGNLAYLGEEYGGGVARVYFEQSLIYENTVHVNIYWIATDQIATLGG